MGVINEKLAIANNLITSVYMPIENFQLFNDSDLPSNSDVVLVLSQYLEALELWRSSNLVLVKGVWYWNTEEKNILRSDNLNRNYSVASRYKKHY